MGSKNPLQEQLSEKRFLHGVDYVKQNTTGIKKISTSELAHLNQILTGQTDEPWRYEEAVVQIPSGQTHQLNVLSNPVHAARDLLGAAEQIAGNHDFVEAAFRLYTQLVLLHLFNDANRRTAALATFWLLRSHAVDIDAHALAKIAVGDLRQKADYTLLRNQFEALVGNQ